MAKDKETKDVHEEKRGEYSPQSFSVCVHVRNANFSTSASFAKLEPTDIDEDSSIRYQATNKITATRLYATKRK